MALGFGQVCCDEREQPAEAAPPPPEPVEPKVQPVRSVIESLYAAGKCPRIHVNGLHEGVVCPEFVIERWRDELIIDLDPTYPLDLRYDAEALEADLSFDGQVSRCRFPYRAIYVVADRATGHGVAFDEHRAPRVGKREAGVSQPPSRARLPARP